MSGAQIHPDGDRRAGAELGADVSVGAYTLVGPHVRIGAGTVVGPHVVIEGRTTIGARNQIFQFASIGAVPQDLKYHGEDSELVIGDDNRIREFCTLQPGTEGGGMVTRVGNGNLLMNYSHVAHDCILGDRNIVANGVQLGGHVTIEDGVVVGALAGIHQFVAPRRIGDHRRRLDGVAGRAAVLQRHRRPRHAARPQHARPQAPRLRRRDHPRRSSAPTASMFQSGLRVVEASPASAPRSPASPEVERFVAFIEASERGVCRVGRDGSERADEAISRWPLERAT